MAWEREHLEAKPAQMLAMLDRGGSALADPTARDRVEATRAAIGRIRQLGQATPWSFVPVDWLTALETNVDPLIATVESWATTDDESRPTFPLTWTQVATLWAMAGLFLPAVPIADEGDVATEVSSYRDRLDAVVDGLEVRSADVEGTTAALEQRITTAESQQTELASVSQQAVDGLKGRSCSCRG